MGLISSAFGLAKGVFGVASGGASLLMGAATRGINAVTGGLKRAATSLSSVSTDSKSVRQRELAAHQAKGEKHRASGKVTRYEEKPVKNSAVGSKMQQLGNQVTGGVSSFVAQGADQLTALGHQGVSQVIDSSGNMVEAEVPIAAAAVENSGDTVKRLDSFTSGGG